MGNERKLKIPKCSYGIVYTYWKTAVSYQAIIFNQLLMISWSTLKSNSNFAYMIRYNIIFETESDTKYTQMINNEFKIEPQKQDYVSEWDPLHMFDLHFFQHCSKFSISASIQCMELPTPFYCWYMKLRLGITVKFLLTLYITQLKAFLWRVSA